MANLRMFSSQTFQSTLGLQKTPFRLDKALFKGIKEGIPSLIVAKQTPTNQNSLPFNPQQFSSHALIQLRKKYDIERSKSLSCQQRIKSLTEQRAILQQQHTLLLKHIQSIQSRLSQAQCNLTTSRGAMESTELAHASYLHMVERLKADIILHRKEDNRDVVEYAHRNTRIQTLSNEQISKVKLKSKCSLILPSLCKIVSTNALVRQRNIAEVAVNLTTRDEYEEDLRERERKLEQAQAEARQDKSPEEKQLGRVLYCNLFFKGVLRQRMEGFIRRYREVEKAFAKIKQETSVESAQDIVARYFNRQQVYGALVEKVALAEKRISREKLLYGQLIGERDKLVEAESQIHGRVGREGGGSVKYLEQYHSKWNQFERISNLVAIYGVNTLAWIRNQSAVKIREKIKGQGIRGRFKILKKCLEMMLSSNVLEEEGKTSVNQKEIMEYNKRNLRIRTIPDVVEEEETEENDQEEYLQYNRKNTKKKYRIRTKTRAR